MKYKITLNDFKLLIRDNDYSYINDMALKAKIVTEKFFGKTIDLYIPIYISNYCDNDCSYCNFSISNKIKRHRLSIDAIKKELEIIKKKGFDDVLILTGGYQKDFDLILTTVSLAKKHFDKIGVEIFACTLEQYKKLKDIGVSYVTLYQECYDKDIYLKVHKKGNKRNYEFRYSAPERILSAGIRGIGMGVLYGLSEPIYETIKLAEHIYHLKRIYWDREFSISFPRIKDRDVDYPITDIFLAKTIFLFRLLFPDVTLNLSTRESPEFRDGMFGLGINKISAESSTSVGGYLGKPIDNGQFEIDDKRKLDIIKSVIQKKGYCPTLKNYSDIFD